MGWKPWAALLCAWALTVVAGCTSSGSCVRSASVSNVPGSFSLSSGAGGQCSDSHEWKWQNNMPTAKVMLSSGVAQGTLHVTLKDASGKTVYDRELSGTSGTGSQGNSQSGTPGQWTVSISTTALTGGLSLQISSA